MTRLHFQLHRTRRATAWLLLLLCVWMGTGGVLHHTEEETARAAGLHSASGIHRLTAALPADACAACEWTQGLQGKTLSVYHVQSPLFLLRPPLVIAAQSPPRRVLRLRSSRAPPAFLPNC